jgi:simple sugar transport system permease protein
MLTTHLGIRIARRERASVLGRVLGVPIAVVVSFLVIAALIAMVGANVSQAFTSLFEGAFGSPEAISGTLLKSTPLIFTGLATVLAFRGKMYNLGAEGQLFLGAMAGYWMSTLSYRLPVPLSAATVMIAGFIAGGLGGLLAGVLKTAFGVAEMIGTMMIYYIANYLLSFLLSGPWKDPQSYYMQTATIPQSAKFPLLPGELLHVGFLVAIVCGVLVYLLLQKTPLGYEIRAIGSNPDAARFKGIDYKWTLLVVLFLSGGLAGMAGAGELAGPITRLRMDISPGYGFTGIAIAFLAGLDPISTLFAAVFFGGLINGSINMETASGVPVSIVDALQAFVLLFYLVAVITAKYRIERIKHGE